MMISLGGNIVPREVNDFERADTFSYQGFAAMADHQISDPVFKSTGETEAEHFASEVHCRALDFHGKRRSFAVWTGIILQVFWLSCIFAACWFLESGTVVTWWCTMSLSSAQKCLYHTNITRIQGGYFSGSLSSFHPPFSIISVVLLSPCNGKFEFSELLMLLSTKTLLGSLTQNHSQSIGTPSLRVLAMLETYSKIWKIS